MREWIKKNMFVNQSHETRCFLIGLLFLLFIPITAPLAILALMYKFCQEIGWVIVGGRVL